jgi:hypothetical protein
MPADEELSSILNRRQAINEALDEGKEVAPQFKNVKKNIYSEFHEFSRREIKEYEKTFNRQVCFIFKLRLKRVKLKSGGSTFLQKCWYLSTKLHDVIFHKILFVTFTCVTTSNPIIQIIVLKITKSSNTGVMNTAQKSYSMYVYSDTFFCYYCVCEDLVKHRFCLL